MGTSLLAEGGWTRGLSGAHARRHFFSHQARRVKKRTSLRSSRLMKFTTSCKRPPPRSVPSGSKPSRWPSGRGSEDTPATCTTPLPEGTSWISSVQDLATSATDQWEGARGGTLSSSGVLNVTNHVLRDVRLHRPHCSLKPFCHSPCPPGRYDKLCGLGTLLTLSRAQVPPLENEGVELGEPWGPP